MSDTVLLRENQATRRAEAWRPPLHAPGTSPLSAATSALRRFLDLQFGSIWRDLARILPGVRGQVVDVGCGAQPFRPLLSSGVRYIGVDTADAEANFGYRTPDTLYYQGDTLPITTGTSDLVLCTETLEHVLEPSPFLRELGRCLKPGGELLLTVPFAARWHFVPFDYWRYTPSSLDHLLRQAGFRHVRVYARGDGFTVACYKVMGCILPLLLSPVPNPVGRVLRAVAGLLFSPLLLACAVGANLSLAWDAQGEDCLGYTALAEWSGAEV